MRGRTIEELTVGDRASFTKTVSESDIYLYAGVTGDLNPAHIDKIYAEKTVFKGRIAHGMLMGGFISAVMGTQLPGPGTIYLRQELEFVAPVHIGDTITAEIEVLEIIQEKKRVRLKTDCTNQDGKTVVRGEALASPPKGPRTVAV
jgi:3-hydroxybutyryl-CoA dehydratase